jgi:hypothetical protein
MLEEVGAGRLSSYPTVRRELMDLARQSSMSSADLEMQGLPAWLSGIRVDGMEVGTLESAALVPGSSRTAALPLAMFDRAAITASNPDVEWSSAGGRSRRSRRAAAANGGTEVFGSWGSDVVQGGFRVAGAVIPDTANFLSASRRPASRAAHLYAARGSRDRSGPVRGEGGVRRRAGSDETSSDRITGFASLAWQLSENTQVDTRASFATLPTASGDFLSAPGGIGGRTMDATSSSGPRSPRG